jgi:hypothetical protein
VAFEPDGLALTALDGTHAFRFTEAVSFQVLCDTQSGEAMFDPITLPFGVKMLFNTVKLKPGVKFEDVELAVGEMCNVVKDTYGDDKGGFIAGQVFRFSGFVSAEGSLGGTTPADEHYAIVTYWCSFEQHEHSHADEIFTSKFEELAKMCSETRELGYDMLWQGTPERG